MNVTKATNSDKQAVLEFCKNTFSWGDYIGDVWDSWINEDNFLVIRDEKKPVAICHVSIHKLGKQIWIEGIRVNELFRRKGYASELVKTSEKIGKQNNCKTAYMLIASSNTQSLDLARMLHYENFETWNFYSLKPKKINLIPKIKFASYEQKLPSIIFASNFLYVNSWRWIPLDDDAKSVLINKNRIIYFENDDNTDTVAILSHSEYFGDTMLVTLISDSKNSFQEIFSFIQNFAHYNNDKRIQILTKLNSLPDYEGLENRFTFNLMKKNLVI